MSKASGDISKALKGGNGDSKFVLKFKNKDCCSGQTLSLSKA